MQTMSRIVAFVLMGFLLSLPVLGADDKDKKAPPKDDIKKADAAKEDPAKKDVKKDDPAKKDEPAKKDIKKEEPVKKAGTGKMPVAKGKAKGLDDDPAAAEKKLMQKTSITATVMAVVEDKKALRLKLTIPYVKVNQGAVQNYYNAQVSMMKATNAQGVNSALQQMAQAEAQIYEVATTDKEVEWTATEDVKVRMRNPPLQFDEKGRIKRYTPKELKELKGNDRLPGYPGEFSDIKTGQIVTVTLLKKREAPRPRRGEAELGDNLPQMSTIMIIAEPKN